VFLPLPLARRSRARVRARIPQVERFDEVVVLAEFGALDAAIDAVESSGHEDGQVVDLGAQLFGHGEAVSAGEHGVEHHQAVREAPQQRQGLIAVRCPVHRVALVAEVFTDEIADAGVDFNQRNANGSPQVGG